MKKQLPKVIIYVVMLFAVFASIQQITNLNVENVTPEKGEVEFSNIDLSSKIANIKANGWGYYPGEFYTPEDFAGGKVADAIYDNDKSLENYGTYRLLVNLPSDKIYGITGHSFPFSQRVFIGGKLVEEVGTPAKNRDEATPHMKTYDYAFMPAGEKTEIIFHVANFHHRQGARNSAVKLSEISVVEKYRALEFIRTSIVIGCLLTVCLYFFGMFAFFSKRLYFLFLAVACLSTAIRMTLIGEKHIMTIFPDLSWFVAIRAEYLCLIVFVSALLLYFFYLYPGMLHKTFVIAVMSISIIYTIIVLFTDSLVFTTLLKWYTVVWVTASVVTLVQLARQLRHKDLHTILIFAGFMIFVATAVYDEIAYAMLLQIRLHHTIVTGVLVCVFMNMIALTLDFSEKEKELSENRVAMLLSQIQPHFLYNILVIIKQLCVENPKEAEETVTEFSGFLRNNLDAINLKKPIRFERELQHVHDYLALEQKRFADTIAVQYDIGATDFELPALTLQPLVENAVRYGLREKGDAGTIWISSEEDKKNFVVTIRDDGAGFDPNEKKQDDRVHIGIENVRGRLEAMCNGNLHVESKFGEGTEIKIEIPKKGVKR